MNLKMRLAKLEQDAAPSSSPLLIYKDAADLEAQIAEASKYGRVVIVVDETDVRL